MNPAPKQLRLAADKSALTVVWADRQQRFEAEYLRVCSPSADVRGHGGEWQVVGGKRDVRIERIDAVGRYAVRLVFSDGHDTGLYSWDVFADLDARYDEYWSHYLAKIEEFGMSREAEVNVTPLNALLPKKH